MPLYDAIVRLHLKLKHNETPREDDVILGIEQLIEDHPSLNRGGAPLHQLEVVEVEATKWSEPTPVLLREGDVLHGYCGGYFGESYGDKTVVHIGPKHVLAEEEDSGRMVLAEIEPIHLTEYLREA